MQQRTQAQAEPFDLAAFEEYEEEIDLVELGRALRNRLGAIVLATLLGLALAAVYAFVLAVPRYQAVAGLYVLNSDDSGVNLSDLQLGDYLAADYVELFRAWEVRQAVCDNLALTCSPDDLLHMAELTHPTDTRILYVTVTSPDAQEAVRIANEYARVFCAYVPRVMSTQKPNLFAEAVTPSEPAYPRRALILLLGALAGFVGAVVVVAARFVLDDSVKNADDVQRYLGLTVFAVVPMMERQPGAGKGERAKR